MPFETTREKYFAQIYSRAIDDAGMVAKRGDSLFRSSPIMGDIWKFVQESTVLLADLTGRNANVFYELGLAHAIGKPVVLVAETMDDVPFDLRGLRVLTFDRNDPDWGATLRERIANALNETLADVLGAVPSMFIRTTPQAQAPTAESQLELQVRALAEEITALRRETNVQAPVHRALRPGEVAIDTMLVTFAEPRARSSAAAADIISRRFRAPIASFSDVSAQSSAFRLERTIFTDLNEIDDLRRELMRDLDAEQITFY
jgi:hypothetical protein